MLSVINRNLVEKIIHLETIHENDKFRSTPPVPPALQRSPKQHRSHHESARKAASRYGAGVTGHATRPAVHGGARGSGGAGEAQLPAPVALLLAVGVPELRGGRGEGVRLQVGLDAGRQG